MRRLGTPHRPRPRARVSGYNAAPKNAIDHLHAEWAGMQVACVGYGSSGAHCARTSLRVTLDRINMADVGRMYAALVAARSASGTAAAGR